MSKVILILGQIEFFDDKAIVNEIKGVLFCDDIDQAEAFGENFVDTGFGDYLIPKKYTKEIQFNCVADFDLLGYATFQPEENEWWRNEKHSLAVTELSEFITDDDLDEAWDKLVAQSEKDGSVLADDVVTMWEPLECSLTVNQLLETVKNRFK